MTGVLFALPGELVDNPFVTEAEPRPSRLMLPVLAAVLLTVVAAGPASASTVWTGHAPDARVAELLTQVRQVVREMQRRPRVAESRNPMANARPTRLITRAPIDRGLPQPATYAALPHLLNLPPPTL